MQAEKFTSILDADFYTGVPDSQLKALCDYLMDTYGTNAAHHVIAANEGNCAALAAGYYLATGKIPVVYMQNSGEGNIINPAASLLNEKVYAIPVIYVIGWRGEPGVHDEPQHIYQGEITVRLLEDLGIEAFILDQDTTEQQLADVMGKFSLRLKAGKSAAFVVRKNALEYGKKPNYQNQYSMTREQIISHIVEAAEQDPIISTTGKASRELFEIRANAGQSHEKDFLTVGSMGHSSSIALGIALQKKNTRIWCIDGDGAVLMHMGAMAVIGASRPQNMIHVVINNEAHETVGGMPTAAGKINLVGVALACGYPYAISVHCFEELDRALEEAKRKKDLFMIEVKCAIGSRKDLGRPTTTAMENRNSFMNYLRKQ